MKDNFKIEIHSEEEFSKKVSNLPGFPVQDSSSCTLEKAALKVCLEILNKHPKLFSFEFPFKVIGSERPDFKLEFPNSTFGIEITEAVDEERVRQRHMSSLKVAAGQLEYPFNVPGNRNGIKITAEELDEHQAGGILRGPPIVNAGSKEDCERFVSEIKKIIQRKEDKNYKGKNLLVIVVEEIVGSTVHATGEHWLLWPNLMTELDKISINDFKFERIILFDVDMVYRII